MGSTFVNPYNFIPLTGDKEKAVDGAGHMTGVIEYSVLTKTPLFIPNTSCDHTFLFDGDELTGDEWKHIEEHKSYDFFSYHNLSPEEEKKDNRGNYQQPVIPGSEIRGMFRSNYEILTESCMSVIDSETVLSKRVSEGFRAGLIRRNEHGKWDLLKAVDYLMRTFGENDLRADVEGDWKNDEALWGRKCYVQEVKEGQKVWFSQYDKRSPRAKPLAFNVSTAAPQDGTEKTAGYILKGEDGPAMTSEQDMPLRQSKHCCHIFARDKTAKAPVESNVDIDRLEWVLKEYKRLSLNGKEKPDTVRYGEYAEELKNFKDNGTEGSMFPVYYSKICGGEGGSDRKILLTLSPACITREIYEHKVKDIIKTFQSCTGNECLCPACSLFGMVQKDRASASRIRFTDLLPENKEDSKDYYISDCVTLAPLSSPKLSNTEFYLKRPGDATFWTYDYYVSSQKEIIPYVAEVSGRKFYWHQIGVKLPKNVEKTNQNMTVRPVREGIVFRGKVYFQGITERELQQLIWLLQAGEEGDIHKKSHGYKLGAAKPLGLGSIAVSVDDVRVRRIVLEKDIISRKEDSYNRKIKDSVFKDETIRNYRIMTAFDAVRGERVSYPVTEGQTGQAGIVEEGYKWFTENHNNTMMAARKNMSVREYMEALKPRLLQTSRPEQTSRQKVDGVIEDLKLDKNNRPFAIIRFKETYYINGKGFDTGIMFHVNDNVKKGQQVCVCASEADPKRERLPVRMVRI